MAWHGHGKYCGQWLFPLPATLSPAIPPLGSLALLDSLYDPLPLRPLGLVHSTCITTMRLEHNTHQLSIAMKLPSAMSYANPMLETADTPKPWRQLVSSRATTGWQQLVLLLLEPKWTKASQRRAATEHTAIAILPAANTADTLNLNVNLRVTSPFTGKEIFPPIQIQRQQNLRSFVRQLQHLAYKEHQRAILIRLKCDDCIIDPEKSVMQCHAATEHMGVESKNMVLEMIAEPLLLTWEQLHAMPAMRKQAGRGGKAACIKQRQLRADCLENNIATVELSRSAYNWRLLLKTMPCLNTPDVIGPGIVGFSFRLLKEIDPNYHAARHVFELNCANGDRWHLHFHRHGNCDRRYLPFEATHP